MHLTGRDRNLVGMQSTIAGLAASGLYNVLAVTGDPPSAGSAERVSGVYDVRSPELMALLDGFNQGRNHYGDPHARVGQFLHWRGLQPQYPQHALAGRAHGKKIAAGAAYFLIPTGLFPRPRG